MLDIPSSIKRLYQQSSVEKLLTVKLYPVGTYQLYPGDSIYPGSVVYPGMKGIPSMTIAGNKIQSESLVLTEALFSGKQINFRSSVASKCNITIMDMDVDVYGYDMEVLQTIGGYEVPLFSGTIDEAKMRDRKVSIVAYDYLYYNYDDDMTDWYNSLTFPITVKQLRTALCDAFHIRFESVDLINDDMVLSAVQIDSITGRELFEMIGEINGAFPHVNRYNHLTYITLQGFTYLYPNADLLPHVFQPGAQTGTANAERITSYYKCEHEQYRTKEIDKVILEDYNLTSGTGNNAYVVSDNMLFQALADDETRQTALNNLYLMIGGLPYVPHSTEMRGRPYVEVGDMVNITTNRNTFDTYVFQRTLKGIQALRDTMEADGEEYHNTAYAV